MVTFQKKQTNQPFGSGHCQILGSVTLQEKNSDRQNLPCKYSSFILVWVVGCLAWFGFFGGGLLVWVWLFLLWVLQWVFLMLVCLTDWLFFCFVTLFVCFGDFWGGLFWVSLFVVGRFVWAFFAIFCGFFPGLVWSIFLGAVDLSLWVFFWLWVFWWFFLDCWLVGWLDFWWIFFFFKFC